MNILFIEDDEIESMKLQRTVAKQGMRHTIQNARNGEEALVHLRSAELLPDLILLDLNMPRMNGLEFLEILKGEDSIKFLPTVILTTSQNRADLMECFRIGVAGYIIKPLKYEEYETKLKRVLKYWEVNELVKA
ncbi:MAG: response regulator [Flavobacteriaceae bacterium]|nr:response regulator [Flavobacteriaceae bacterium]MDH3795407.1 response regulator [Flavobacteriaceae bacterium]